MSNSVYKYPLDLKKRAVAALEQIDSEAISGRSGSSICTRNSGPEKAELAAGYGVSLSTIQRWKREFGKRDSD